MVKRKMQDCICSCGFCFPGIEPEADVALEGLQVCYKQYKMPYKSGDLSSESNCLSDLMYNEHIHTQIKWE